MILDYFVLKFNYINNLAIYIPTMLHYLVFCFLNPVLSVKDKSAWQEITSSWQFLALCLSLIFTSGLVWYSEKKYTERLLAEQEKKDEEQRATQQSNEPTVCNSEEASTLQSTLSGSVDQAMSTSLNFYDIMLEVAFWGIIVSSVFLIIFVCWLIYNLFLKFEKKLNNYFADLKKNYTAKKPWWI